MTTQTPPHLQLALRIYMALPFSHKLRQTLRDMAFSYAGGFFSDHPAYIHWRGHRDPSFLENKKRGKQYGVVRSPKAPPAHDWYKLALTKEREHNNSTPTLDVIIPVYRGYDETLLCLYQAISAPNATPQELIVINDASPDQNLSRELRKLAAMGLFTLLENEENLGFVKTVNRGLRLHPLRDCLILNADCIVHGNYADRMLAVAQRYDNVATVTPLSNNGELASYPLAFYNNGWRNELLDHELDALCAAVNGDTAVEVPTGVGYCMLMTRKAMDSVGVFDEEAFGKGYGEENDFCLRAGKQGFTNMLAGGVFTRHIGGLSFQHEKDKRVAKAIKIFDTLHPGYHESVAEWKHLEPAKNMRIKLDLARLNVQDKPSLLMVLHTWGGGTEKHVRDMAQWLEQDGVQVFYMMPVEGDCTSCELGLFKQGTLQRIFTPNLRFRASDQSDILADTLQHLDIRHIHIHHLIGYDDLFYSALPQIAQKVGVAYDVTLHDYFSICPRTNLINETMRYCGEPDEDSCNRCIVKNTTPVTRYKKDEPEIKSWRHMHHGLLQHARHIFVPSDDLGNRLAKHFSDIQFITKPHPETFLQPAPQPYIAQDATMRVALIGAIHDLKGAHVLEAMAKDAHTRKLPIEFHILGHYGVFDTTIYEYNNVKETGKFTEAELPTLVADSGCLIALFLSVCPETFSYTLSQAWQLGLYPVAFDIGAQAERIKECQWGHLLPLDHIDTPAMINDALLSLTVPEQPDRLAICEKESHYANMLKEYYGLDILG